MKAPENNHFCFALILFLAIACMCGHARAQNSGSIHSGRYVNAANAKMMQLSVLEQRGHRIFLANQCLDCHRIKEKGCVEGISLDGVGKLRSSAFLTAQLADPEKHVSEVLKKYEGDPNLMPSPNLSKDEIKAVVAYLKTLSN